MYGLCVFRYKYFTLTSQQGARGLHYPHHSPVPLEPRPLGRAKDEILNLGANASCVRRGESVDPCDLKASVLSGSCHVLRKYRPQAVASDIHVELLSRGLDCLDDRFEILIPQGLGIFVWTLRLF